MLYSTSLSLYDKVDVTPLLFLFNMLLVQMKLGVIEAWQRKPEFTRFHNVHWRWFESFSLQELLFLKSSAF
jgi:hypothetical protein